MFEMLALLVLVVIVASAIGVNLHGAWDLVDEAVCGVILVVPWCSPGASPCVSPIVCPPR
jgi:hypothetical protein